MIPDLLFLLLLKGKPDLEAKEREVGGEGERRGEGRGGRRGERGGEEGEERDSTSGKVMVGEVCAPHQPLTPRSSLVLHSSLQVLGVLADKLYLLPSWANRPLSRKRPTLCSSQSPHTHILQEQGSVSVLIWRVCRDLPTRGAGPRASLTPSAASQTEAASAQSHCVCANSDLLGL